VNSYICIYGDVDIEERLSWMDENYLKNFPAIEIDSHIEPQKPFDEMKVLSTEYAVATDADCSEKTYYSFCTAMDVTLDQEKCRAFELISYVLLEMPGAPLKQAILDAGIGTDIDADFCDILRQSMFSITTKNAKPGLRDKFYEVIVSTLKEIVKEGIDRKDLEAAINSTEFREREADFGGFPKGLLYVLKTFKTWLYDDTLPYDGLIYEDIYKNLREKLGTDYYEKLIEEYILGNPHAVLVEMNPKPGLALENEKAIAKKLEDYKASLSDEELDELVAQTKALKAYQEEQSPKEVLEKIPLLKREDIRKKVRPLHNEEKQICGVKTIHHDIHTNGIIYLDMLFDVNSLSEYVPQISFLATLLGYMDTTEHTFREFDTETNFYSGGIGSDLNIYSLYNSEDVELKFDVKTKTLAGRIKDTVRLMAEMMFKTVFTDEKHLREVVAETRSRLKVRLMSAGHQAAVSYSMAGITVDGWYNDYSMGIGYYDYLVKLDENFDGEKEKLIKGCEELVKAMFKKENMLISCTCDDEDYAKFEEAMSSFIGKLDDFEKKNKADVSALEKYRPDVKYRKTAFSTPAEIQYAAVSGSYKDVPDVNDGAMTVTRHLLSYGYLWNEVRVKGGAYGVMCKFTRDGSGSFVSYRDPNLSATYEVYKKAADYLANYEADEREVTKTIIGTISGLDTPLTPAMDGKRSMNIYLTKTPLEVLQKERDQILACTKEDIRKTADAVRKVADAENICVIGNEQHIKDEASMFEVIKPLS
ncbi:insulinase family protein, partial [Butyribacter intestini]